MVDLLHQMIAQGMVRLTEEINMPIDKSKITNEMIKRAMECDTAEELIALAKSEDIEITKEEAESYLAELDNFELNSKEMDKVAGGSCYLKDCDFCSTLI